MHLLHETTVKNTDGTYEITVYIVEDGKRRGPYTYLIPSDKEVRDFLALYQKGKRDGSRFHGKALSLLNKHRTRLIRK
jgi:hypothetical protein